MTTHITSFAARTVMALPFVTSRVARLLFVLVGAGAVVACSSASADGEDTPVIETGEAVSEAVPVGTALRATSAVSLREEPSTSAVRLATIANGATVKVLAAAPQNGFYNVSHDGDEGWVFGRYLMRADDTSGGTNTGDSGSYANTRNIALVYQGSCSFLHRCDSYSRGLPAGQVNWGCLGHGEMCVDSEHWASGPSRAYCGKTVKFCKGTTCTTAVIKDVSVSHDFEGSQGVFDALGIGYGGGSTCSNTYISGDPHVTVSY
jgi:uncharacterized protein YraI